jgi:hypothetical protein
MSFFKINFFASPLFIAVAGVRGQGGLDPGWEGGRGILPSWDFAQEFKNLKIFAAFGRNHRRTLTYFSAARGGELLPKSPGYNYAAIYYSLFGNFWFIMKIK